MPTAVYNTGSRGEQWGVIIPGNKLIPVVSVQYDNISGVYRPELNKISNTISNKTSSGNAWGTCIANNDARLEAYVANVGSGGAIFVLLGTGASSAQFSTILQAGTAEFDGKGGTFSTTSWKGPISVSGNSPSNSNKYIAWELT